jgi:hypothetical protein
MFTGGLLKLGVLDEPPTLCLDQSLWKGLSETPGEKGSASYDDEVVHFISFHFFFIQNKVMKCKSDGVVIHGLKDGVFMR